MDKQKLGTAIGLAIAFAVALAKVLFDIEIPVVPAV